MNRRRFLLVVGGVVAVGAAGVAAPGLLADDGDDVAQGTDEAPRPTAATARVGRGTLSTSREFKASVSFGDPWPITTLASGTVTGAHAAGHVVGFGEELVRIDNRRLTLAEGSVPMYRKLEKVNTRGRDENGDRLQLLEGLDVIQLQTFLIAEGHDADGDLAVDGVFGGATEDAVEAWQEASGLPETGAVDSGQLIFSSHPLRVAKEIRIGSTFAGLEVNRPEASVLVDTSNRDRAVLAPGTVAEVTLADGSVVMAEVVKQEQAEAADGSRVWRSTLVADSGLAGEASSATAEVTEVVAADVLIVPASALLALAEGGFALERTTPSGTELVRVEVGELLDGRAEISGDVQVDDEVVIPT